MKVKDKIKHTETIDSINSQISDIVKNGSPDPLNTNEFLDELQGQFIEMGQLKSDFDTEKFSIMQEGNFLCHQFHFLMRQYSLTLTELRRMLLNIEEKKRQIDRYQKMLDEGITKYGTVRSTKYDDIAPPTGDEVRYGDDDKWVDIELARVWNEMKGEEVIMTNKISMVRKFEECRKALIEKNGGKEFTNAEYQEETPRYWKWKFEQIVLRQVKAHATGISAGTWENIEFLEAQPVINPDFQVKMLNDDGLFDLKRIELEQEVAKQLRAPAIKKLLEDIERDKANSETPQLESK